MPGTEYSTASALPETVPPDTDSFPPEMPESIFNVSDAERGMRLDAWLSGHINISRAAAVRLIETGQARVNGTVSGKSYRLRGGEQIQVELPEPVPTDIQPENIPLDIVYEDDDVIVVNKPKGMVVHPAPGHPGGTLVNALLYHCGGTLSGIGGELRPGIVHRIDRDTTGLIIAAKNDFSHQHLSDQLRGHTLARTYHCIVTGIPRDEAGTINAPVGRHAKDRKKMAVTASGREAVTHWKLLERLRGCAYLECRLETGRTHQIRVHMAYTGHPVLGDPVYGKAVPGLHGQCLHASELRFVHPRTGENMLLRCPLPDEFMQQLYRLRQPES